MLDALRADETIEITMRFAAVRLSAFGTKRTSRDVCYLSAFGDKADRASGGVLIGRDFKEMDRLPIANGFRAIQNNSDLSQGRSRRLVARVDHKNGRHLDGSVESKGIDRGCQRSPI